MMSLETIHAQSRKAARESAKAHLVPMIVEAEDIPHMPPFKFPFIGNRTPRGYRKVAEHFVDSSGFVSSGEAALTIEQFKAILVPGHAYATTEAGQFQVYVSEFLPPEVK